MEQNTIYLEPQGGKHNGYYAGDELLESTLSISSSSGDFGLTKREGEILQLIVAGQTNKEIARQLSRSERTVEYHRNRLMRKMSAHNSAQLVRQAIAMGVV